MRNGEGVVFSQLVHGAIAFAISSIFSFSGQIHAVNRLMESGFEDCGDFSPVCFMEIRVRVWKNYFGNWLSSKFDTLGRMKEWRNIFCPFGRLHAKNKTVNLFSSGCLDKFHPSWMPYNHWVELIDMVGEDKVAVWKFFELFDTFDFLDPRT